VKDYKIRTVELGKDFQNDLEGFFRSHKLTFRCMKFVKDNNDAVYLYRISSPDRNYDLVNQFLLNHKEVKSFDV
jgi:mRNA-degrading endonuclease RelE of RelBE toxin-antitoxin system